MCSVGSSHSCTVYLLSQELTKKSPFLQRSPEPSCEYERICRASQRSSADISFWMGSSLKIMHRVFVEPIPAEAKLRLSCATTVPMLGGEAYWKPAVFSSRPPKLTDQQTILNTRFSLCFFGFQNFRSAGFPTDSI